MASPIGCVTRFLPVFSEVPAIFHGRFVIVLKDRDSGAVIQKVGGHYFSIKSHQNVHN